MPASTPWCSAKTSCLLCTPTLEAGCSDEDIAELGAAGLPAEHVEDYFALRWARPDDEVIVVGSTGFGDLDWQPLPPESVSAISLRDRTMSVMPLETA